MADYISTLQILSFLGHVPVVTEVLAFKGKSNSSDTVLIFSICYL